MAKGAYVGVGGVARKVKKIYVGVDGVARKVKKAYVGVNGVARLVYSASVIERLTDLSVARYRGTAGANSEYVMFIGSTANPDGNFYQNMVGDVDAYDANGTRVLPTNPVVASNGPCGGQIGDYVIHAHGDGNTTVYAYDSSLTRKTATADLQSGYCGEETFAAAGYWVIVGGSYGNSAYNNVRRYNANLTRSEVSSLTTSVSTPSVAANSQSLIVAGGTDDDHNAITRVFALNTSFTRVSAQALTVAQSGRSTISGDEYAMVFSTGGVHVYDENLTQTILSGFTRGLSYTDGGYYDGKYVIYGVSGWAKLLKIDEATLTCTEMEEEVDVRGNAMSAMFGSKLYVAGGLNGTTVKAVVQAADLNEIP